MRERLLRWLAKFTGSVASAGYVLLSVALHRGYIEYLPSGAKVWMEKKVRGRVDDDPG